MKKKVLVIMLTLNLFNAISCFDVCEDFKYMDYQNIRVLVENPYVQEGDSLAFGINFENIEYMALRKSNINFGNEVYASECDKGYGGDKYPLTRITITCDSDFNAQHPANTSLNDMVSASGIGTDGAWVMGKVSDFLPSDVNTGYMYLSERPDTHQNLRITVEFEKSNGDVLSSTSELIAWE